MARGWRSAAATPVDWQAAGRSLAEEAGPDRIYAHCCDVLDAEGIGSFARDVATRLGPADILVNNAGEGRVSTFAATDDEAWRAELELKFFSVIRPTRAFLPQIEQSDAGSIVCVNSLLARQPEPHMVATSAARAGVLNLVRSLATELAPRRIRVNAILIGLVESGQWRRRYDRAGSARRDVGSVDAARSPSRKRFRCAASASPRKRLTRSLSRLAARLVHDRNVHRCFRRTFASCLNHERITVGELVAAFLEHCSARAAFGVISIHNMPILDAFGRRAATAAAREASADPLRAAREAKPARSTWRMPMRAYRAASAWHHQHRDGCRQRRRRDGRGADGGHAGAASHRADRGSVPRSRSRLHSRGARSSSRCCEPFPRRRSACAAPETALGTLREAVRVALTATTRPGERRDSRSTSRPRTSMRPISLEPAAIEPVHPRERELDELAQRLVERKAAAAVARRRRPACGRGGAPAGGARLRRGDQRPGPRHHAGRPPAVARRVQPAGAGRELLRDVRRNARGRLASARQRDAEVQAQAAAAALSRRCRSAAAGPLLHRRLLRRRRQRAGARRPRRPPRRTNEDRRSFASDLALRARPLAPWWRMASARTGSSWTSCSGWRAATSTGCATSPFRTAPGAIAAWPSSGPRDGVHALGGGIGQGVQMALGAALAAGGRKTFCLVGDGGCR